MITDHVEQSQHAQITKTEMIPDEEARQINDLFGANSATQAISNPKQPEAQMHQSQREDFDQHHEITDKIDRSTSYHELLQSELSVGQKNREKQNLSSEANQGENLTPNQKPNDQNLQQNQQMVQAHSDDKDDKKQSSRQEPEITQTQQQSSPAKILPQPKENRFIMAVFNATLKRNVDDLFERFDTDRSGYLDYYQARNAILQTFQEIYYDSISFSDAEFDAFMKVCDKDGNGKIDKEEMFNFYTNVPIWLSEQEAEQGETVPELSQSKQVERVVVQQPEVHEEVVESPKTPHVVMESETHIEIIQHTVEIPSAVVASVPEIKEMSRFDQHQEYESPQKEQSKQEISAVEQHALEEEQEDVQYVPGQEEVQTILVQEEVQYVPVQEEVQYVPVQEEVQAVQEEVQAVQEEVKEEFQEEALDIPIQHSQEEDKGNLSQESQISELKILDEISNPILFTEHMTVVGRIPMMFFLPNIEESHALKGRIEAHGGRVVEQHECGTYQIRPKTFATAKIEFSDFYKGQIFDQAWIDDSILVGELLKKDDYKLIDNEMDNALKLNIGKKKRYTVMEGVKLYSIMGAKKTGKIQNDLWKSIASKQKLPERSSDSLKAFWKKHSSMTLEDYLIECIFFKTDFCLSFKEIPNEEFVERFREKYVDQFQALAQQYQVEQPVPEDEVYSDDYMPVQLDEDGEEQYPDQQYEGYQQLPATQTLFDIDEEEKPPGEYNDKTNVLDMTPTKEEQAMMAQVSTAQTEKLVDSEMVKDQPPTTVIDTTTQRLREFNPEQMQISEEGKQSDISWLIGEETKVEQLLPKPVPVKMKKITKLVGIKRSYNMYTESNALVYNRENRPFQTLEQMSEKLKAKRHKEYIPQEKDVPQYDPQLFDKQMDLEIMEITVNEKSYYQQGIIVPQYYRKVVRKTDHVGTFKRLNIELEGMAKMYSMEFEEVQRLYMEVYCDKAKLREILSNQSFTKWSELEDICVERGDRTSRQYKALVKDKGLDEIERRRVYLSHVRA